MSVKTKKVPNMEDGQSAAETAGCCHLEVFERILIGDWERVPLTTEHNGEATQAKTEESHYFIFFPHWAVFVWPPPAVTEWRTVTLTMWPLCPGATVAEETWANTASSAAAPRAMWAITKMAECTLQSSLATAFWERLEYRDRLVVHSSGSSLMHCMLYYTVWQQEPILYTANLLNLNRFYWSNDKNTPALE